MHELRGDGAVLERDGDDQRRFAAFNQLQTALLIGQLEPRIGLSGGFQSLSLRFGETVIGESESAMKRLIELTDWLHELEARGLNKINPNCPIHKQLVNSIQSTSSAKLPVISIWTLYRAQKKVFDAGGALRAALPKFSLRGRSTQTVLSPETGRSVTVFKPRLDPVVGDHLIDLLAAQQADEESQFNPGTVHNQLRDKLVLENASRSSLDQLRLPARVTIARWINKTIPAKELSKHRNGAKETAKLYRSTGARVAADRILQFLQFDDIDARIFLVDEDTGLPWGTPKFTFGVDEKSKYVTGLNYGPEARCAETAISTVIHAVRRKNMNDPEFALCKESWVGCGKPGIALLDNASYNTSVSFKLAMISMGIDYAFSKPKEPTNKSAVEHFNGLFKREFVAKLRGACVKKNQRERIGEAMKRAKLTLAEFQRESMKWIVDDYSHKRQEDGYSPIERWRAQENDLDLRVPRMDRQEFSEFILPERLKFRDSGGVERNDLRYQNDRLKELRAFLGRSASVDLRVNPKNLEQIFVCDRRAEEWFTVPCIEDPAYVRGLTDRQHKLARSFIEERKKETVLSVAKFRTARDDLRSQALKDSTSKQLKVRRKAYLAKYAFRGVPAPAPAPTAVACATLPAPLLPNGAASHGLPPPTQTPAAVQTSSASSKPTKFELMMEEARAAQARAST